MWIKNRAHFALVSAVSVKTHLTLISQRKYGGRLIVSTVVAVLTPMKLVNRLKRKKKPLHSGTQGGDAL